MFKVNQVRHYIGTTNRNSKRAFHLINCLSLLTFRLLPLKMINLEDAVFGAQFKEFLFHEKVMFRS